MNPLAFLFGGGQMPGAEFGTGMPGVSMPGIGSMSDAAGAVGYGLPAQPPPPQPLPLPGGTDVGLGAALTPQGPPNGFPTQPPPQPSAPLDIRPAAQQDAGPGRPSPTPSPASATTGEKPADKLLGALRGIQPPAKPDVVKPTSPGAPAGPRAVAPGNIAELALARRFAPILAQMRARTLGDVIGIGKY